MSVDTVSSARKESRRITLIYSGRCEGSQIENRGLSFSVDGHHSRWKGCFTLQSPSIALVLSLTKTGPLFLPYSLQFSPWSEQKQFFLHNLKVFKANHILTYQEKPLCTLLNSPAFVPVLFVTSEISPTLKKMEVMPLPVAFDFTEGKPKIKISMSIFLCVFSRLTKSNKESSPQPTGFVVRYRTC